MRVPPIGRVWSQFKRQKRSILNFGGNRLKELPYTTGERVHYRGFGGNFFPGTVVSCEHVNAGYAQFIRVKIDPDDFKDLIQINLSLFPDRVKKEI